MYVNSTKHKKHGKINRMKMSKKKANSIRESHTYDRSPVILKAFYH